VKTDIAASRGFFIADARERCFLPLPRIPETADLHTPEKTLLLWKSSVGISAG
jgi:hypothetical protein